MHLGGSSTGPLVSESDFFLHSNKALFFIRNKAIQWDNCAGTSGVEENNADLWDIGSGQDVFYLGLNTPTHAGALGRNGKGLCIVRVKYL